ncbi:hypothetical protein Pcac1_g10641 [Phytophthora cactorum]|uniref:Uncharacterized protein n=1 Tax=Phytophthora cactorum TaxID=29920 RepID=A0A329SPX8_9STRA|nr:hypothetical protein Pcac1_g10641 [Phytophthora cactorum]RAW37768.1 hypothetical protein PC110_g5970 [Phytophthora cactorum]
MAPEAYVQVVKLALAAGLEVESTVGEVQEDVVAGSAFTKRTNENENRMQIYK